MGEDRDYKVTFVEARNKYPTPYGDMQAYAMQLEGVDGYVQLGQKPETAPPYVGQTLHGHLYEQTSTKGSFLKFKKVNPAYAGGGSTPSQQASATSSEDTQYMITLLEAIAKEVGAESAIRGQSKPKDTILDDIDEGDPIDLSEIPF